MIVGENGQYLSDTNTVVHEQKLVMIVSFYFMTITI